VAANNTNEEKLARMKPQNQFDASALGSLSGRSRLKIFSLFPL
ncbi:hypothetical protein HMPREF1554_02076, partial [Porphyromonas gingivalis F0569]